MDQFDFKKFDFDLASQVQAFHNKLWADQNTYQAISLQTESTHLAKKKLCVFDMDSTFIQQEVIDEMARLFGFHDQVSKITEAAMRGQLDFASALRERCKLFRGLPSKRLAEILPALSLSHGVENILKTFHHQQIKVAIVSGGFQFVLEHFQKQYPVIEKIHAHTLEVAQDGTLTGQLAGPMIDATQKQKIVSSLKTSLHAQLDETICVGDGANDIEMMKEAGISVSFCGKPVLNQAANTLILEKNMMLLERFI